MPEDNSSINSTLLRLNSTLTVFEKEELREQLKGYIIYLLLNDFNKLVQLLYQVDVNEQKLKQLIKENPQMNASVLITDLLIQRQEEKIKTRETFKSNDDIADEDKW